MYSFQTYPQNASYHQTFEEVRLFLRKHNESLTYIHFHWSRWEWMFARGSFKEEELSRIILFRKNNVLVGLLSFEDEPGISFLIYDDEKTLKKFIIEYIVKNDIKDRLVIPNDEEMKSLLSNQDYEQTDWKDPVSRFSLEQCIIDERFDYNIVSLEEDYRLEEIHSVLWRGFDHPGPPVMSRENLSNRAHMTSSPQFKKRYTFVAKYKDTFVSYAGIWYEKNTKTALVEPVATVPEHRRKGLAKSLIYHGIKAVQADGATDIFVGSLKPLYLNIGFKSFDEAILFKKRNQET